MKTILLLIVMIPMICSSAWGASCTHGYPKDDFCFSEVKLNWWSAHAWCKAQGMQLAKIYEACPKWKGGSNACPQTYDVSFNTSTVRTWTATANGDNKAYMISNPKTGSVSSEYRSILAHALCYSKSTNEK